MSVPRPQRRPGGRATLAELLAASHFRLGPHTARVAANLARHGGHAADAATRVVLLAPGAGARPESLAKLGAKPAAVLGGDPLLRAMARRAGGLATDDLEAWIAFGRLAELEVSPATRAVALVAGGGAA